MENLEIVLRITLVVIAVSLIALVLIQQGRGASMGAAFGSGASQTMFGSGGASSFLTSLTSWLAVGFFVITFALAWVARERAEEMGNIGIPVVEDMPAEEAGMPAPVEMGGNGDVPMTIEIPMDGGTADVPALEVAPAPSSTDEPAAAAGGAAEGDVPQ